MSWLKRLFASMLNIDPSVRLWAMILACPPITLVLCWIIWLIQRYWRGDHEGEQIHALFIIALCLIGLIAIVFVAFASVKLSGRGPGGFGIDIGAVDTNTRVTQVVEKTNVQPDPVKPLGVAGVTDNPPGK